LKAAQACAAATGDTDAAAPVAALSVVVVQPQASRANDRADKDAATFMIFLSALQNIRSW
jgi:hypothetical protein